MDFIQEATKFGLIQNKSKAVLQELKSFVDVKIMTVKQALSILKRS